MAKDTLEIEILEDGTIKTTTDHFSAAHHQSAEEFLNEVSRQAAGGVARQKRGHRHTHTHTHVHNHGS